MKKFLLILLGCVFIELVSAHAEEPRPEMVLQLGHAGVESAVAWSPDGNFLATGDVRGAVKVWRVARAQIGGGWTLALLRDLPPLAAPVAHLKWLDGSTLEAAIIARASGDKNSNRFARQWIWNARNGKLLKAGVPPSPLAQNSHEELKSQVIPARSPDGSTLALAGLRWTQREIKTREEIHEIYFVNFKTRKIESVWTYRHNAIANVSFGGDASTLFITPTDQSLRALHLTDVETQTLFTGVLGHDNASALSPNGALLARGDGFGGDGVIRLLNSRSRALVFASRGLDSVVDDIQFAPDGNRVAATDGLRACVWDAANGKLQGVFRGHNSSLFSVAWSPGSKVLATVGGDGVNLWNVDSGELEGRLMAVNLFARLATFSPDGQSIATSEQGKVRLWSTASQECLHTFPAARAAMRPAFSSDGKLLAFAGENGKVCIRETATGNLYRIWRAHDSDISTIAFSPDASTLVTASDDGTVKFWRIASQKLMLTWRLLPAARDGAFADHWIAFTPEGFYSGSKDCEKYIRWRVGDKLLPAAEYSARFRRPDLVEKMLAP